MSNDEQMAVIGRMVTERKTLRQKEAALADQVARASKVFQSLSGYLANYKGKYGDKFKVDADMIEFANMERVETLVTELLQTRKELFELEQRLDQVS